MYIKEFIPFKDTCYYPSQFTETKYAFVSDDIPDMELSPRYHSEEECRVWYGQVAHELFDEFDVPMGKLKWVRFK